MAHKIKDTVVLVTGGACGIGAGVVRAFLGEGAKHVAILDVAQEAGVALEKELTSRYGAKSAKFIKCDVTNDEQLIGAFNTTAEENGGLDLVINNAGLMNDAPGVYKKQIEVNVTSLITGTLKAIEMMDKDKGGKGGAVINISSIAGITQSMVLPIYFATKSAVLQFSNCIGKPGTFSRTGVRVIAVCFGLTDTTLIEQTKYGSFDQPTGDICNNIIQQAYKQRPESAVRGVVESFKHGASGSTWLADKDRPPVDITADVTEGFLTMAAKTRIPGVLY